MLVTPEKENEFDPNAMVVRMSTLENISLKYHKEVKREETKRLPKQKVKDIGGELIGKVPANLCKLSHLLLLEKDFVSTTCHQSTENLTISKKPDSGQSFKRNPGKKGRRGGGAIILCSHFLKCNDENYNRIYVIVEGTIRDSEFQGNRKNRS